MKIYELYGTGSAWSKAIICTVNLLMERFNLTIIPDDLYRIQEAASALGLRFDREGNLV